MDRTFLILIVVTVTLDLGTNWGCLALVQVAMGVQKGNIKSLDMAKCTESAGCQVGVTHIVLVIPPAVGIIPVSARAMAKPPKVMREVS